MILRDNDVYSSQDEESDSENDEKSTTKGEGAYRCTMRISL